MNKNIRDYINLIENAQIGESEGVAEGVAEDGYGNHPSKRVDPRTGKRYVPPKSPLGKRI